MKNREPTQAKRPDFAEIARRSFELYEGRARIDDVFESVRPNEEAEPSEQDESEFATVASREPESEARPALRR